jgi:predicted MFS family arabinose efflux permease
VGLFSIAGSLAALPAMRYFGRLSDRWGPHKVMLVTGFLIPLIPLVWIFARLPVHGILINIPAGLVWAGFNLAAFNFLLSLAPPVKRARYTALFQIAVALSSAAGAAIGGLVVTHFGYIPIFVISGIGRFLGIFLFARFVHQKEEG